MVYLVSGLWHGAGWSFVAWGLLHGLGQVAERLWGSRRERLPAALRWALTFGFVNVAWVFFRAPRFLSALRMIFPGWKPWISPALAFGLFLGAMAVVLWPRNTLERMEDFRPTAGRALLLAVLAAWSILSFTGVTTFIYSNF